MRIRFRVGRVVAAGALLAGGLATTSAAPAVASPTGALSCSHSWSNPSGQTSNVYGTDVRLRSGPHSGAGGCAILGTLQEGELLWAHCWDTGTSVNGNQAWWHVRRESNDQNGWVSDYYTSFITNNGSHC
ncbi:hypothetical protein [Streptomyces sp. NPDC003032]